LNFGHIIKEDAYEAYRQDLKESGDGNILDVI